MEGTPGVKWDPRLTPDEKDKVITKRRYDSFEDTELTTWLRSMNIQDLVVAGIRSNGVVINTVL